eukprot:TRINITY_DN3527_c0_g3_i2.p1 TRINITY_DN3527_c0_g3~~TRINITY_DN3527_c0_g3_i2.p1  ORF type:complete len:571 (+),score=121.77 TRINITY_DN3527_c0_g3_i2:45-1757(+)
MEKSLSTVPHYKGNDELKAMLYGDIEISMRMMDARFSVADICFICDITRSMQYYIDAIREVLMDFLKNVSDVICAQPRVAFVGFRDKGDKEQIEYKEFTSKPKEMVEFLEKVKCYGGGDMCEDLVAPLKKALTLDWMSDLNYVYLLLDAPTHGRRYHDNSVSDDYLDDDKEEMLEKLIVHYRKSRINLAIIKYTENVNGMIRIIRKYYDSQINELKVIENFVVNFQIKEMADSPRSSEYRNFRKIGRRLHVGDPVAELDNMDFSKKFVAKLYTGSISGLSFESKKYNYKFELNPVTEYKCEISGNQLGTGTFAKCYPLCIDDKTNYVAKFRKDSPTKPEDLKSDIEGTLIAKHFAERFNHFLKNTGKKETANAISVVPLDILEKISSDDFPRVKVFLAQRLLDGVFCKLNNNYGWRIKEDGSSVLLAQAFSHFTYEFSLGTMMVVDIQGIVNEKGKLYITDPAIHSYLYKDHFGATNHGKLGMIRFFKTHECNEYCKQLNLADYTSVSRAKYSEAKEKYKEEKGLAHLYEEFVPKFDAWKKKIRDFDPSAEPEVAAVEEEEIAYLDDDSA